MSEHILYTDQEFEWIYRAQQKGFDEELVSYAKQIQRRLSADGDSAEWIDCLEMAFNELMGKSY